MSSNSNQSVIPQSELHKTFIAMLFAFVVSVVAQQIAEILIVATDNWKFSESPVSVYEKASSSFWLLMTAASHSLLALLMVSISWVMWSRSQARSHTTDLQTVFSIKFVVMLIEFFLVILYFAIAKSIEADFSAYQKNPSITGFVSAPSARPEASQIRWVFFVFFIWDVLVDIIQSPRGNYSGVLDRILAPIQGLLVYCSISLICFFGAWAVFAISLEKGSPYHVILGDIALIVLLLFFSLAKKLEYFFVKIFPKERGRQTTKRPNRPTQKEFLLLTSLVIAYIACIVFMVKPL